MRKTLPFATVKNLAIGYKDLLVTGWAASGTCEQARREYAEQLTNIVEMSYRQNRLLVLLN